MEKTRSGWSSLVGIIIKAKSLKQFKKQLHEMTPWGNWSYEGEIISGKMKSLQSLSSVSIGL